MPNRMNPIAQYLIALAITVFAYAGYARFAVPAIEGPPNLVKRTTPVPTQRPPSKQERKSEFAWLFASGSWELESSNVLQTESGKILFRDYKTLPDGQLVVFPFTMIMERKADDQSEQAPMVLRCMEEARVTFDRPLTIGAESDGKERKMKRAQLAGEVVIYRPPSKNSNDSVEVITRNVQIESDNIFTLEEVEFQLGPHRGKGRNLLIEMAHDEVDNNLLTSDFTNIEGIKRLELAFLHHLRLAPTKKASTTVPSRKSGSRDKLLSHQRSPIDVTSKGPFIFDFATSTAIIRDQVHVRQNDEHQDELLCEELTLRFDDSGKRIVNPIKGAAGALKLNRVSAVGTPAVIHARSRKTRIRGQRLDYDMRASRVFAVNETGTVTVANPDFQFDAKSFVYGVPDDDSLGPLTAKGPGRLLRMATAKQGEFRTTWSQQLEFRETPDGLKYVDVSGNSKATVDHDTSIAADRIQVWLAPSGSPKPGKGSPRPGKRNDSAIDLQSDYRPVKLTGTGSVRLESPKLSGSTQQLTAVWPQPTSRIKVSSLPLADPSTTSINHVRRPIYQESEDFRPRTAMISPANRKATIGLVNFERPVKPTRKFDFDGQKVHVELNHQGIEPQIRRLAIDGNVSIKEMRTAKPGKLPFEMSGQRVLMTPQGSELFRVQVAGAPEKQAEVNAEGLRLKGVVVNLDQSANKLWVEGAGNMNMNPPAKASSRQSKPDSINVSWGGGMVFDGSTLYFEQDVIMNAAQQQKDQSRRITKSLSQGLSVQLKQRIDFRKSSEADRPDKVELGEMVLVNKLDQQRIFKLAKSGPRRETSPIVVENQNYDASGKLMEQQKVIVPKATLNPDTGDVRATGPGTIMNHQLGGSSISTGPNRKNRTRDKNGITYLQVNFDDSLRANTVRNEMKINGNVRTIYSPVKNWKQTLNPDATQPLVEGAVKLTCDSIEIEEWQPRSYGGKTTNEILATGNARIYGDLFEAMADRVSYSEGNDTLVLEGTPRSDVHLWHQPNERAERDHLVADKLLYRISDQRVSGQNIKQGSFSPNGNPFGGR